MDGRGFGLSQPEAPQSVEARLEDVEAVRLAAGLERFSILGSSAGTPTAIAYAARHPDRVARLALFGATARSGDDESLSAIAVLMRNHFGTPRFDSFFRDYFITGRHALRGALLPRSRWRA